MKKLVLLIAIVLTTHLSFATEVPSAASPVISCFNRDFYKATSVEWQHWNSYEKVTFLLDSQFYSAYYSGDGELIAVTRNIVSEQLPLKLLLELKKDYSNLWISGLFEVINGADDEYYITLENADETVILKAKAHKTWKVYKKIVKV